MKLGRVALDGSKVKANASKPQGDELWTDAGDREAAAGGSPEVAEPSRSSRAGRGYPLWAGRRGDELPEELQRREARIQRIGEARRALEARAREQAESAGKKPEEAGPHRKTQYNFTDPESPHHEGPEGSCRPTTRRSRSSRTFN